MANKGLTRRQDFLCSILIPTLNVCNVIGILPGIPPDPDLSWLDISSHIWCILFPFVLGPLVGYHEWLGRSGSECPDCNKLEELENKANIEGQKSEKSASSTDAGINPRTVCIFCSGPPFFSSVGRAVDICGAYCVDWRPMVFLKAMVLIHLMNPVCIALARIALSSRAKHESVEKLVLRSVCCCAWIALMVHRRVIRVLSSALDYPVPSGSAH